ncbi:MAG: hypothetical protein AAF192_04095 [Pseudomonadota bacterium]
MFRFAKGRWRVVAALATLLCATQARAVPIDLSSLGLVKSTTVFADLAVSVGANSGTPIPFLVRRSDPAVSFVGVGTFRVIGPPFDFEGQFLALGTDGPDEMEWLLEPQSGLSTRTNRVLLEVQAFGLGTAIDAQDGYVGTGLATVFNLVPAQSGSGGGSGGGAEVPLPAGVGLLAIGLAALALRARRPGKAQERKVL